MSQAVLRAQGSVLTNKYAEGYPSDRYYGGCEHVDELEQIAIDRAKQLWSAEHVNVQPHAGSQANMGVYFAMLDPGDTILSLDLAHGGHLSHGYEENFTGQLYDVASYRVNPETGYLDYDAIEDWARAVDPDLIVSGYTAYPRTVEWDRVQEIADAVDAYHMADIAHITGLVAAGVHPSPVGVADFVTASTHKTIRSGRGGIIMCGEEHASAIDQAVMPGMQGGPLLHNIAGKAVGFNEALQPEFEEYARQIVENSQALADGLQEHGLTLVSGGTDNHLVLVDLRESHPETTGQAAEEALEEVGLICNGNPVPGDSRPPKIASGIRAGTPAITTRGFDQDASYRVGRLIAETVDARDDLEARAAIADEVEQFCETYPLYST